MCFIYNEGKSVTDKRFIRNLQIDGLNSQPKIYKFMTSISKSLYIDQLDNIVNECNNTYHRPIKIKLCDAKDNTYIDSSKEVNDKDPTFKIGDHVRIPKCKEYFC